MVKPPPLSNLFMESRAMWAEVPSLRLTRKMLTRAPTGDGHPVMLFPALMCPEQAMFPLRRYLRSLGYAADTWGLGANLGLTTLGPDLENVERAMEERYKENGKQRLTLIGWSLGGIAAREVARRHPDKIRQVITMASPFNGNILSVRAVSIMRRLAGMWGSTEQLADLLGQTGEPPEGVPATALFSRTDGIVPWQNAVENEGDTTDNVEVIASHIGIAMNPTVFFAVADRLAQSDGEWTPFDRSAVWKRFLYPSAGHKLAA